MADAERCICPSCTRAEERIKAHPAEAVALLLEAGAFPLTIDIHLDQTDDHPVWWADSPQVPGFTAVAHTLKELRTLFIETFITERLVEHPKGAET